MVRYLNGDTHPNDAPWQEVICFQIMRVYLWRASRMQTTKKRSNTAATKKPFLYLDGPMEVIGSRSLGIVGWFHLLKGLNFTHLYRGEITQFLSTGRTSQYKCNYLVRRWKQTQKSKIDTQNLPWFKGSYGVTFPAHHILALHVSSRGCRVSKSTPQQPMTILSFRDWIPQDCFWVCLKVGPRIRKIP